MSSNDSYTELCSSVTLQSNKEGFFRQFADRVSNAVNEEWLDKFMQLPNENKILKCWTDKKVRNEMLQTLENIQEVYRGKSARLAMQRRQEAEHFFKRGNLEKALLLYTQSVIRAPAAKDGDTNYDDGITLALALWNRSEVLFDMKKYHLCLDDVKLAMQEKLPKNLKLNAFWRMAECYINVRQFNEARISLKIALKLANNDWLDKINNKIEELETLKNESITELCENTPVQWQELSNGSHPVFEQASQKLHLAQNKIAGKHFIAGEQILTGETLLTEDPYVSCLSPEKYGSHCHHCFQRLESGVPCSDCCAVAFCSLKCRLAALNSYHKYECHYLDLLIGSGMSVLSFAALRIVTQQNVKYFIDALDPKNTQHHYNQVQSLTIHDDKRSGNDFLHRTLMAIFLLAVLKKSKYFLHPIKVDTLNPQELMIGRVLLRNLEVLQFNAHEIFEPVEFKNSNKPVKALNIGIGLYKTGSYFNHDCYPAVSRFFVGTKLFIKSCRPIDKNELVGDNYGVIFTKHDLTERQQKLKSRYWFKCECCACLQNWPKHDSKSDTLFKLRCEKCKSSVTCEKSELNPICKNCFQSCDQILNESKVLIEEFDSRKEEAKKLNEQNVSVLCKLQDSLANYLYPPNRTFDEIQEKLLNLWMQYGNVFGFIQK
ncbi:SET and MYND domain-containing protein 4-like [Planococcus citri]|uniref:SET and MYND domain-containing protein 4-like n=1 Tax=Planococcus citri TaxID=170843 RepID=UPI0031F8BC1D